MTWFASMCLLYIQTATRLQVAWDMLELPALQLTQTGCTTAWLTAKVRMQDRMHPTQFCIGLMTCPALALRLSSRHQDLLHQC